MAESLDDFVAAIQSAVSEAQKLTEDHHVDLVNRFFYKHEESGQLRAETMKVYIPMADPANPEGIIWRKQYVPVINLAALGAIRIKELKVDFEAVLNGLDTADDPEPDDPHLDTPDVKTQDQLPGKKRRGKGRRGRHELGLGPLKKKMTFELKKGASPEDGTKVRISITFEGTDPPEGVVRLNDTVLRTLP